MADQTHSDSDRPGNLPDQYQEVPAPDPHRGEPAPPPNQGRRPEADPAVIRPDEEEPVGPVEGLVSAAGAEAKEEATGSGDPEAEALLAQMGVEEEGIEAGQILGLIAAIIAAVVALSVVLIFLFYEPFLGDVEAEAENVGQYADLDALRVDATAKLNNYTRTDSTYGIPITRAMGAVVAEYEAATPAEVFEIPSTAQRWNTVSLQRGVPRAVQVPAPRGPFTAPVPETGAETDPLNPTGAPGTTQEAERGFDLRVPSGEEVGVDEPDETIPDEQ